jgi:hypothetical protein
MSSPKDKELKMHQMLNAWRTLAPEKKFGGMTLEEFQAIAAPAIAERQTLAELEDKTTQSINARDVADAVFTEKAQLVVNGVLADPTEGPDSSLYEAMGYTRKSERKSGLTRKGAGGTQPPPAQS